MTLGTSETHSRKCTAKDETGAKAPNKKGVKKMKKCNKTIDEASQSPTGIFCLIFKSKEKDKKGFHEAFVIQSHLGYYLDAEEMFLETRDKMLKELEENLKEKFKRSNYNFFVQVISDNLTIDPIAEEKELEKRKKYYESLEADETPETVH